MPILQPLRELQALWRLLYFNQTSLRETAHLFSGRRIESMKYIISILTIVLVGIIFVAPVPTIALEQKTSAWKGNLANGQILSEEGLAKILKEHKEWVTTGGKQGKRADLSKANLSEADLSKAILSSVNLSGTHLLGADLSGANLVDANLSRADLVGANLREANLREANLSWAILNRANLSEANLSKANLSWANLRETNLKKAKAKFAEFGNSLFETEDVEGLVFVGAEGFSTIKFDNFETALHLVDLCKIAKETGLRSQERALTSALYKYHLRAASLPERILTFILLGFTTDFGAAPWRSFWVLAFFIVVFSFYYIIILRRQGKDGIWKIWIPDRVRTDLGKKKPTRLTLRFSDALRIGFYFSVLSAFSIGWRELNVGNWISRVQRQEYTYQATGWTRTISGIQSLLSVYLLAIWALTYFGRPFE